MIMGSQCTTIRTAGENGFAPDPTGTAERPRASAGWRSSAPSRCATPGAGSEPQHGAPDQVAGSPAGHVLRDGGHNANLLLSVGRTRRSDSRDRGAAPGGVRPGARRRFGHSVARPPGRRDAEMELRGAPMRVEMAIARQDGTAGESAQAGLAENPIVDHAC